MFALFLKLGFTGQHLLIRERILIIFYTSLFSAWEKQRQEVNPFIFVNVLRVFIYCKKEKKLRWIPT